MIFSFQAISNAGGRFRVVRLGFGAMFVAWIQPSSEIHAQAMSSDAPVLSRGQGFEERGGAEIYDSLCAACHQKDAKGAVGAGAYPPLAGNRSLVSVEYLEGALFSGLRGMPPVGKMLTDDQAADVINYVRTHFGNNFSGSVSAANVKAERDRLINEAQ